MKRTFVAVLFVVALVGSLFAAPVAGATDDGTTAVVAVGDSDEVLLTANAVASKYDSDVISVPADGPAPKHSQLLAQREEHGDLHDVVLVGTDLDGVEVDVPVRDRIESDRPGYETALRVWDESDSAYITTESDRDHVTLALQRHSAPVFDATTDIDDIESALDRLNVSTVYLTDTVSDDTRTELAANYTTTTTVDGVSFDQPIGDFSSDLTRDTEVVTVSDNIGAVSQIDGSVVLSPDHLESLNNTTQVYAAGVSVGEVRDHTDASVTPLDVDVPLQSNVIASGYPYPVLMSEVEKTENGQVNVDISNIGQETVTVFDGASVTASWTGLISDSSPSGELAGEEYQVSNENRMQPGETFSVSLTVDRVDNGGHPELDYYIEAGGGLVSAEDDSYGLPILDYRPPVWLIVGFAAAVGILVVPALLSVRRTGRRTTEESRMRSILGGNFTLPNILAILGGLGLIIFFEPVTTTAGVVLILAAFGINRSRQS